MLPCLENIVIHGLYLCLGELCILEALVDVDVLGCAQVSHLLSQAPHVLVYRLQVGEDVGELGGATSSGEQNSLLKLTIT